MGVRLTINLEMAKTPLCVWLQQNDFNIQLHYCETNTWKSQTKHQPNAIIEEKKVVGRTFRWTVRTTIIPGTETSLKIMNFFKNAIKKRPKMVLMKKEGKHNKQNKNQETRLFIPPRSIFTAAQSHRMESWGAEKKISELVATTLVLIVSRPLCTPLSPPPYSPRNDYLYWI